MKKSLVLIASLAIGLIGASMTYAATTATQTPVADAIANSQGKSTIKLDSSAKSNLQAKAKSTSKTPNTGETEQVAAAS